MAWKTTLASAKNELDTLAVDFFRLFVKPRAAVAPRNNAADPSVADGSAADYFYGVLYPAFVASPEWTTILALVGGDNDAANVLWRILLVKDAAVHGGDRPSDSYPAPWGTYKKYRDKVAAYGALGNFTTAAQYDAVQKWALTDANETAVAGAVITTLVKKV